MLNLDAGEGGSPQGRSLFFVVVKVPEANFTFVRSNQFVVLVVEGNGFVGGGSELEEQFFGNQVVLVDYLAHGEEEEVAVGFT